MDGPWVNLAEQLGADLHLDLAGPGSRRAVLIRALREAIRTQRFPPGTKLPPYRSVAADLGLARNTVADAYAELVAEGWLMAKQGSGTRVAERAEPLAIATTTLTSAVAARPLIHDLRQGLPDASAFPRSAWLAAARRAITQAPNEAFGPGDPRGRIELRVALTEYLARARGVRTSPDRIVICSGFAHALRVLFPAVLRGPVAVESYQLAFHRLILAAAGVATVALPLDEEGAQVAGLTDRPDVSTVLLTPAHQFPLGGPLAAHRRAAVVDRARAGGGLLIEDDYDGEFRYDRQPVGAVQGLDPDHVLYIGSVSKSLSPALRLGWMVLPERLVDAALGAKGQREAWAGVTDQLTLAELITSGDYDRHIRRTRQRYRRRRDHLVQSLAERVPHVVPAGIAAGLHTVLRLPAGTEDAALDAATRAGIELDGLAAFRHPDAGVGPAADGLVVGYAAPPDLGYRGAVDALCTTLASVR
ncbi:PLP-dependent aminotransferase family protein [Pseudonocardia sp. GCM10023141]|uniref:MocR-like pyridoxine biosynthesis transcription factor PdxR n=1 Tax=Pseudonocardia sp. GCM10023141 TaxID=3252653 RepID=UPI00360E0094